MDALLRHGIIREDELGDIGSVIITITPEELVTVEVVKIGGLSLLEALDEALDQKDPEARTVDPVDLDSDNGNSERDSSAHDDDRRSGSERL